MARSTDNPRTPSGELFPTDSPVPAGQLIGRRDDVAEMHHPARGRHAPRRRGPAAHRQDERVRGGARAGSARRGAYTAKVDLFRVSDAGELAEALAAAVIANRSAAHRALRRARSAGRAALSAAQARARA